MFFRWPSPQTNSPLSDFIVCALLPILVPCNQIQTKINRSTDRVHVEFKMFVVQCVFIVSVISFNVCSGGKKGGKFKSLNFAESNVHRETNAGESFAT